MCRPGHGRGRRAGGRGRGRVDTQSPVVDGGFLTPGARASRIRTPAADSIRISRARELIFEFAIGYRSHAQSDVDSDVDIIMTSHVHRGRVRVTIMERAQGTPVRGSPRPQVSDIFNCACMVIRQHSGRTCVPVVCAGVAVIGADPTAAPTRAPWQSLPVGRGASAGPRSVERVKQRIQTPFAFFLSTT